MNIKFKIKNIYDEEKWWNPDEGINYYAWILGDDGFDLRCDKIFLCDAVDDYRSLCREEPLLAELIKIPRSVLEFHTIYQNWKQLGDNWLKSFIFWYQEHGFKFSGAIDQTFETRWTGAKFDGENLSESYENIGEYFAREYGFADCLNEPEKLRETLRLDDFGRAQEKRLGTSLQSSCTFGEWVLVKRDII